MEHISVFASDFSWHGLAIISAAYRPLTCSRAPFCSYQFVNVLLCFTVPILCLFLLRRISSLHDISLARRKRRGLFFFTSLAKPAIASRIRIFPRWEVWTFWRVSVFFTSGFFSGIGGSSQSMYGLSGFCLKSYERSQR